MPNLQVPGEGGETSRPEAASVVGRRYQYTGLVVQPPGDALVPVTTAAVDVQLLLVDDRSGHCAQISMAYNNGEQCSGGRSSWLSVLQCPPCS